MTDARKYIGTQGEEAWDIHGVTVWAWTPEQQAAMRAFVVWLEKSDGNRHYHMDTRREDLMWHAFEAGFKAVKP